MVDGRFIPEPEWPGWRDMYRDYKNGGRAPGPGEESPDESWRSPVLVCLLENLESSQPAQAVTLTHEQELPRTFDVSILGEITNSNTVINLRVRKDEEEGTPVETSENIPWDASAAEVKTILSTLSAFQGFDLRVTLGKVTNDDTAYPLGRWLISTGNRNASFSNTTITGSSAVDCVVNQCHLKSTGYVRQVVNPIPTGDNTPLRTGAVCWAYPVEPFGNVILSAEPRKFTVSIPEEEA